MPDLSRRVHRSEIMEDPSIPQEEFSRALDELETINRLLGGHSTSLSGVAALLPPGVRRFSLLDIGTGGGDFPRRLVAWAKDRGIVAEVKGIDLLPAAIEHARRRSGGFPEIGFAREDLLALQGEEEFDIVHAALLLHHLDDVGAREALRRMNALARWGIVVNDLRRHALAWYPIRGLTRLFSASRIIRNDAPLSVERAFLRGELEALAGAAGLTWPRIRGRWAFRWQMVVHKEDR
jgi:2-polyprenyl-3-methyl-5-hydroxy-6-metoxy-1,4-benzoquinol methylase